MGLATLLMDHHSWRLRNPILTNQHLRIMERMLRMPPKPHVEMKLGKRRTKHGEKVPVLECRKSKLDETGAEGLEHSRHVDGVGCIARSRDIKILVATK